MSGKTPAKKLLFDELLEKGRHFCAYRDRCKKEVSEKLSKLGATGNILNNLIKALEQEGFIDEKRFAEAFALGKFENNQWGRLRIRQELVMKKVPSKFIDMALEKIDEDNYLAQIERIAEKKLKSLRGNDEFIARGKTAEFCIRKGFEPDLVLNIVNKLNVE